MRSFPRLSRLFEFHPLRRLAGLCLFAAFLTGCGGGEYPLPEPEAMGLPSEDQLLAEYGVDREWWKGYGDPQLDQMVETALARNADLARSVINVEKALYQAKRAGADRQPALSGNLDAGSTTNTRTGDASRSYGAGLGVSYEIDLWRRLRDAAAAGVREYQATREDLDSARLTLIGDVVDGYHNLLRLRQSRAVTADSLVFHENLLELAEARRRAGKTDGLPPVLARQAVLATRNDLTELDTQIKTEEQNLRNLLNLTPDDPLPATARDTANVRPPSVDLDVPLSALALRPDVRAAEYRILAAFRNQAAERAGLWPSITLGGSLNVSSDRANALFDVPLLGGTIRINLPFLQWNTLRWNIRISEAEFESARLNFAQTVTTALNEVDAAYFRYRNALLLLENIRKKHEEDVIAAAYREQRYRAGAGELEDWLEALNTEKSSLLAVLQAGYDVVRSANAVFKAMGGRLTGTGKRRGEASSH